MAAYKRLDAYHFYETEWEDYESLRDAFEWDVPDEFNIASYICDRWAEDETESVAIYAETAAGDRWEVTYEDLQRRANQLANYLSAQGVSEGDRVGVALPQSPEVMIGYVAAWKLGAMAVPLSTLFGGDALAYRMNDCSMSAILTGEAVIDTLRDVRGDLPALHTVALVDGTPRDDEDDYEDILATHDDSFETRTTGPDDDACIVYTSGTTGDPKGVLHGHRFLLGMLPVMTRSFIDTNNSEGEVWWSPVEWNWIGSLGATLPGLFYRVPIVAYQGGKFDPEVAFEILERYDVTFFGGPPTMLRMMKTVPNAGERFDVGDLTQIGSGGEALEADTIEWVDETFDGATVQEAYGQTESSMNVGDYAPLKPTKREKIGVEMPGHVVEMVDQETGEHTIDHGDIGEFAVKVADNPGVFKEYWNMPEMTEAKFHDGWLLTEDLGTKDADGYFSFETRADDVIISSGYKIGPAEIEETLAKHESVADSGVIGVPHDERGEVPRAYVTVVPDAEPNPALREELQTFVKDNLAKYKYPRELEFIDELPRTNTGKVSRHNLRERAGIADS